MKNKINSKILKVVLTLVLSFVALFSCIYCQVAREQNLVKIEFLNNDGYIKNIRIGETNYVLSRYNDSENLIYDKSGLLKVKRNYEISFEYSKILNINIDISLKGKNKIKITENGKSKSIEVNGSYKYSKGTRFITDIVNYFKNITLKKTLILISLYVILYLILFISINYLEKFYKLLINSKVDILNVIKFFISILIIYILTLYMLLEIFNLFIIPLFAIPIIILLYKIKNKVTENIENIFAILVTLLGLFMAFILPPFQVPDEASHFFKAYSIFNEENISRYNVYRTGKAVLWIPEDYGKIIDKYNMDLFNSNYTISAKEYFSDMNINYNKKIEKEGFYFGNTVDMNEFCYLPSAIISMLVTKLGLPFMYAPLLSRIINLFIFALSGYYALRILPRFKKMFLAIMLLPITLQQAAAINQDSITNSIIFVILALLFNFIYSNKKNIETKKIILLILLSLCLGFCKAGYFAILFLVILIPQNKFKSRKSSLVIKSLVLLPCLILTGCKYLSETVSVTSSSVDFYSMGNIINNPIQTIKICLNTVLDRFQLDFLTGLVNGFGWSTVWHKEFIKFVVCIIYFIILFTSIEKKEKIKIKDRVVYFIVWSIMFGMVYASMLFAWTREGATRIDGLQCRYFIPITIPFYLSISNNFISLNLKNRNLLYILGIVVVNILSFITIIRSFYI